MNLVFFIKKFIDTVRLFSNNNRFIILSATPIYDKPFEIGLTLNTLNPRLYFPDTQNEFNSLFFKTHKKKEDEMQNKKLFYWMCNGYVSYFSGGDPKNFPYKRIIEKHHKMGETQANGYANVLLNEVKDTIFKDTSKEDEMQNKNYFSKSREFCNIYMGEDIEKI